MIFPCALTDSTAREFPIALRCSYPAVVPESNGVSRQKGYKMPFLDLYSHLLGFVQAPQKIGFRGADALCSPVPL